MRLCIKKGAPKKTTIRNCVLYFPVVPCIVRYRFFKKLYILLLSSFVFLLYIVYYYGYSYKMINVATKRWSMFSPTVIVITWAAELTSLPSTSSASNLAIVSYFHHRTSVKVPTIPGNRWGRKLDNSSTLIRSSQGTRPSNCWATTPKNNASCCAVRHDAPIYWVIHRSTRVLFHSGRHYFLLPILLLFLFFLCFCWTPFSKCWKIERKEHCTVLFVLTFLFPGSKKTRDPFFW